MTKITEIMKTRRNAGFSQAVQARLGELGWTPIDLARAIYGVDENGKVKRVSDVWATVVGKQRARRETLERWATVLGVSADEMMVWYDLPPPKEVTSEREQERKQERKESPAPVPKVPDQIALTVDNHGRATLRLHLVSIPLRDALAIIELVKTDVKEERDDDGS